MRIPLLSLLLLAACGGGGTTAKDASIVDAPKSIDSQVTADGPVDDALVDAPPGDALGADAMIDAPAGPVLKVKNYLAWCSVKVNGGTASSLGEQDVAVTAGTIPVSAVALSGFELGPTPWHDTAGDTGAGDPGTVTGTGQAASSATTVVVGAGGKCVWVCCPFTNGTGCPTTDQCP
jgi:hypothetical protein